MSLEDWLGRPGLASGLGCQVHVRFPGGRRLTFESDRRTLVVGRGAASDVRLEHPAVGARHLVVHHRDEGFAVTDLGAAAGTRASGRRLEAHATVPLADGEVLEVGPLEITFEEVVDAILVDDVTDRQAESRSGPGSAAALGSPSAPAGENGDGWPRSSVWTLRPELLRRPIGELGDGMDPRRTPAAGLPSHLARLRPTTPRRVPGRTVSARLALHWPLLLQIAAATAVFAALALLVAIVLL